jgi:5-methylcytosine-specific restriction endonuclease McrA
MKVFVLDAERKPLLPCHAAISRQLLSDGKAVVFRQQPFTIIIKRKVNTETEKVLRLKIDPGSKTTGFAIVDDEAKRVVYAAELEHRGSKIKMDLQKRAAQRRNRRSRKARYRQPRFDNRAASTRKGRIAPSLMHRVLTIETWVKRFRHYAPIGAISMELIKFDTQKMMNAEISGVEYQRGTLEGYEVREYLLEKWDRQCAYCGAKDMPLEIEHIRAKSKHGSDRVSNLTLACEQCNDRKGNKSIEDFLKTKPELLKRILAQARAPLHDAAAVNTTRWKLLEILKATGLPVECGSGGLTKWNRKQNGFKKFHWLDAANAGRSTPMGLIADQVKPLFIKALGYGTRQMTRVDKFGFPRTKAKSQSRVNEFRMGDLVFAKVSSGKYAGNWRGTLAGIRARGDFDVKSGAIKFTTNHRNLMRLQARDGFAYSTAAKV